MATDASARLAAEPPIPVVLTIAGSDPSGGAGIQADLKTFQQFRVYGAAVLTALTVQNTRGVRAVHPVAPDVVIDQLDAVTDDLPSQPPRSASYPRRPSPRRWPRASVAAALPNLVLDPVLVAGSGDALGAAGTADRAPRPPAPRHPGHAEPRRGRRADRASGARCRRDDRRGPRAGRARQRRRAREGRPPSRPTRRRARRRRRCPSARPARASPSRARTAPAARCPPPSPRGSAPAIDLLPAVERARCATCAPRSPPPRRSAVARVRSIIASPPS